MGYTVLKKVRLRTSITSFNYQKHIESSEAPGTQQPVHRVIVAYACIVRAETFPSTGPSLAGFTYFHCHEPGRTSKTARVC